MTLREIRLALGLTQPAFAKKLLTKLKTYQAYEYARRRPTPLLMDRARRMLAARKSATSEPRIEEVYHEPSAHD